MKKKPRKRRFAGYTLVEMIVVLVLVSLIITGVSVFGIGVSRMVRKEAFEREADMLCRFFNDSRKIAMMTDKSVRLIVNENDVTRYAKGETKTIKLQNMRLLDVDGKSQDDYNIDKDSKTSSTRLFVPEIWFKPAGTISIGTTYCLMGRDSHRYLIVQPVTGRMYLSDAKPK